MSLSCTTRQHWFLNGFMRGCTNNHQCNVMVAASALPLSTTQAFSPRLIYWLDFICRLQRISVSYRVAWTHTTQASYRFVSIGGCHCPALPPESMDGVELTIFCHHQSTSTTWAFKFPKPLTQQRKVLAHSYALLLSFHRPGSACFWPLISNIQDGFELRS